MHRRIENKRLSSFFCPKRAFRRIRDRTARANIPERAEKKFLRRPGVSDDNCWQSDLPKLVPGAMQISRDKRARD